MAGSAHSQKEAYRNINWQRASNLSLGVSLLVRSLCIPWSKYSILSGALEGETAIETLTRRLPGFHLVAGQKLEYSRNITFGGL